MKTHLFRLGLLLLALCAAAAGGCARKAPLDRQVKAASKQEFEYWKGQQVGELTAEQAQDLDVAIQELKILVMAQKGRGGAELLDEGMRELIHGKTLRDALRLGLQARRDRMEMERGEVRKRLEHDSSLRVRDPGSESAAYLERIKQTESDRLQKLTDEIAKLDSKLRELDTPKS